MVQNPLEMTRRRSGQPTSRETQPAPPEPEMALPVLVQSKVRGLVSRATRVFETILRHNEAGAKDDLLEKQLLLWKLRLDAAEKLLKLAAGPSRVGRPPGTAAKTKDTDAEDEPEDRSGVLHGAFPHLEKP